MSLSYLYVTTQPGIYIYDVTTQPGRVFKITRKRGLFKHGFDHQIQFSKFSYLLIINSDSKKHSET